MKISKLSFVGIVLLLTLASFGVVSACSCTPGFWKAEQHWWTWPSAIQPDDVLTIPAVDPYGAMTFDLNGDGDDDTYLEALQYKGGTNLEGAQRIFLRAWVAGSLNDAYDGWVYSPTSTQVILRSNDRAFIISSAETQDWENNLGPCDVLELLG